MRAEARRKICPVNPDQKLMPPAYEDAIKLLYAKLFEGYEEAAGDPAQEQQADQRFTTGVELARRARDRAIALLV
jgi:hypothetical protein